MDRRTRTAVVTGLVLVALTWMTLHGLLFYRPLPVIDGYYRFLGLDQRAEVLRDAFGVPRIEAGTLHDLFFLQGYVTAQDRFAQMEAMRGDRPGVPYLGTPLDDLTVLALDAYAAGVTKYIEQHADSRALPADVALRATRPAPWTPNDSLAIAVRSTAAWPLSSCTAIPGRGALRGAPLLSAELVSAMPSPGWYEVGLEAPGLRAIGIALPGVPGIVAGHNGRIAWSLHGRDGPGVVSGLVGALAADSASEVSAPGACAADRTGTVVSPHPMLAERPLDVEDMRLRLGEPRIIASSARIIIDLGDLDASKAALSTGQSGHPAALHYRDQAQLWTTGQLHRLAWTRDAVARTEGRLVLRPR